MVKQALRWGWIHEGLVDQEPAASGRETLMPAQQGLSRKAPTGRVVRIDDNQAVEFSRALITMTIQVAPWKRHDFMAGTKPGMGMLLIADIRHANAAGRTQARERLNRGLGASQRQGRLCTVVAGGRGLQAIIGLGQAIPDAGRHLGQRPCPGVDSGGEVEPIRQGDTEAFGGRAQATAVLWCSELLQDEVSEKPKPLNISRALPYRKLPR